MREHSTPLCSSRMVIPTATSDEGDTDSDDNDETETHDDDNETQTECLVHTSLVARIEYLESVNATLKGKDRKKTPFLYRKHQG